jgi:hypothetical protein
MRAAEPAAPGSLSYTLRFPSDVNVEQVQTWLHALSGLLPGRLGRLWGSPTVALELWASAEHGFRYRLIVPRTSAGFVVGQLRTAVPGMRVTPSEEWAAHSWTRMAELGMRKAQRSLRVEPVALAGSLLASVQGFALRRHEAVVMQWIIRPAVPQRPPAQPVGTRPLRLGAYLTLSPEVVAKDAVADERSKLQAVNFLGVLRVGAQAGDDRRAGQLLAGVRAALGSVRTADNALYARTVPQGRLRLLSVAP